MLFTYNKKIVIISDSHARSCATEVSNYLQKLLKLQVHTGTVILGARSEAITLLADKVIISLIKDLLVIWGWCN
jgi:predicted phosphodiesterase